MKKFLKWGGIILLIPIALFLILSILLYLPPIQNFVVGKVTQGVSESTGMDIKIGRVALSFPINLVVHETTVVNQQDTVLDVNRLKVKVQLWPLIHKKVEVDGLELLQARVNTGNLIEGMSVKGQLNKCYIESHGVDLSPEMAVINQLVLDDTNLAISMADTTAADTTESEPLPWKIKLEKIDFKNVSLAFDMPLDSLYTTVALGKAELRNGLIDLKKSAYFLDKLSIKKGAASYRTGSNMLAEKGFNPSFIDLSNIDVAMDSVYYEGDQIHANISRFSLKEQSGLEVVGTKGKLQANEKRISIPTFELRTHNSNMKLSANADWPLSKIDENAPIKAHFSAHISKNDIFKFVPNLPEDFMTTFPEAPLEMELGISGSLNKLNLSAFDMEIPEHLRFSTQGLLTHALNDKERQAYLEMNAEFPNMQFMQALLGDIVIPSGLNLKGVATMNRDTLSSNLSLLTPAQGKLFLDGKYTLSDDSYEASLRSDSLNLHAFMPKDSLFHLSADFKAKGMGFDVFDSITTMQIEGGVKQLRYGKDMYRGIRLTADVKERKAKAQLKLTDHHFNIVTDLSAQFRKEQIEAELTAAIKHLNLEALGLSEHPLNSSQNLHLKVKSDMNLQHAVRAEIRNNRFMVKGKSFKTKDMLFGLNLSSDSIMSFANSGDLTFMFQSGNGLDDFLAKIDQVTALIGEQWNKHAIDQQVIREDLPDAHLRIQAGTQNPISNFLSSQSISFKDFNLELDASPTEGLSSTAHLYNLHTDSLTLDTIHIQAEQVAEQILLKGKVKANRNKHQEGFTIALNGDGGIKDAKLMVEYFNEKNVRGAHIGIGAQLKENGIELNLIPKEPTLVYRPFHVNEDNFISINDNGRIEANLGLYNDENAGLHLYSTPDSTVQNDLTLVLNKLDLAEMQQIVPYMPDMKGIVNIETHYVQPLEGVSLASVEASIDSLGYYQEPMGNWALSAVYLPKENNEHCIDGYVMRNDEEIASLNGSYFTEKGDTKNDWLDATLNLTRFPLELSNAFVSRNMAVVSGHLNGEMSVKGTTSQPKLDGLVILDNVNMFLPPASMNLRFDKQPIKVASSKLDFDHYKIFALSDSPFVIEIGRAHV